MENETYKKLAKVQATLRAPKDKRNDFSGFDYRSCEDVLAALKPILTKVNALVCLSDEMELIGERYYIKATAAFYDLETGEAIKATAYAREQQSKKGMDESQVTGAASSYARKYALNGLFAIDNTKDADSMNNTEEPAPPAETLPDLFICSECGNEILPQTIKGKTYTAEMIAKASTKKYKRCVCLDCANAIAAAAKGIEQ